MPSRLSGGGSELEISGYEKECSVAAQGESRGDNVSYLRSRIEVFAEGKAESCYDTGSR